MKTRQPWLSLVLGFITQNKPDAKNCFSAILALPPQEKEQEIEIYSSTRALLVFVKAFRTNFVSIIYLHYINLYLSLLP